MARKNYVPSNRNAVIRSREDRTGKTRTETHRRDSGVDVAISTNPKTNSTNLFVDLPDGNTFVADGRTARTIYRVLQAHYSATGKTF
jgi:hypothetical protein